MDSTPEEAQKGLLSDETFDLSTRSLDSTSTIVATPASPITTAQRRPGYQRVTSIGEIDTQYYGAEGNRRDDEELGANAAQGLAIPNVETSGRTSIPRVPVGGKGRPLTTRSADPLLSPVALRFSKRTSPLYDGILESSRGEVAHKDSLHEPFVAGSASEYLHTKASASTMRSIDPLDTLGCDPHCKSRRNIYQGRGNWLSVTLMILAIYSTVFSGMWLLIAIVKPRYGQRITSNGKFPPGTASLLCAAFAKTIELSFVTVFVAFLGQVLSRRAFIKQSRGITIAEMSMRSWVMQPGTMITHWESVRYAALSFLGTVALTGAFMAMLYTTASDALVSPKLKFGGTQDLLIYGQVATEFGNEKYVEDNCQTPITTADDPTYAGSTCIAIEHAGQAYHNYMQYLSVWTDSIASGNGSADLSLRPNAVGMIYDNTTVQGSWINVVNMTDLSIQYNRTVLNVSMAMPHSGVFAAARDPLNSIMQPQDLNGLGEYYLEASVPSPAVNVMCASMSDTELAPLVYTLWPDSGGPAAFNVSSFGAQLPVYPSWPNKTAVDDIFGFGPKYGRRAPYFGKLPLPYNTLLNATGWFADSIYVLLTSATTDPPYMLCSMSVSQSPNCSTEYYASMGGGSLSSRCDDNNDRLAYRNSQPKAPSGKIERNWHDIAFPWATALALGEGITDGDASNARLLTQLIPGTSGLDPSLPSIAEALAVLSGCTLLISAQDAPFIHYWNYSTTVPTLADPQPQAFNATLRTQDYSSGGVQHWQGIFYVVLLAVFVTNCFCLGYFMVRGGLVTDFIEPQNLFALSLNSPSSVRLAGSCGAGPEGEQFRSNWFINFDNDHVYIQNGDDPAPRPVSKRKISRPMQFESEGSPIANMYSKLSNKRASLL